MTTPSKSDWHYFTFSNGMIFLDDLPLMGVTHYDIRQDGNEPIRLTLELFIQPPQDAPDHIKLAIAERLLAKK